MTKIDFPVIVDSGKFNFVIVGPIGEPDGVLARSANASINLLMYSRLMLESGLDSNNVDFNFQGGFRHEYFGIWTKPIQPKISINEFEGRPFRLLIIFGYRKDHLGENSKNTILNEMDAHNFDIHNILFDLNLSEKAKSERVLWSLLRVFYRLETYSPNSWIQ